MMALNIASPPWTLLGWLEYFPGGGDGRRRRVVFMQRRHFTLGLLAVLAGAAWAKKAAFPPVWSYLEGCEFQAEDEGQRANFRKGLDDALSLPVAELKARRYADYQGKAGQWDLETLFRKHLLPAQAGRTLGGNFYTDLKDLRVQAQLQALRKKIG